MKTTMIKTAFILALLSSGSAIGLAAGSRSSFGNTNELLSEPEAAPSHIQATKKFYAWVEKSITRPTFISSHEENLVELWLQMDANGKITGVKTKSKNPQLAEYVKHELEDIQCPKGMVCHQLHFAISFKKTA
jgi:hypothetical protein